MKYTTHQRQEILTFFRNNPSSSFTVEEVALSLPDIGKSTLYRMVGEMQEEGSLRRTGSLGLRAQYQFSDRQKCPQHMHIRCTRCGRTEHLDKEATEKIERIVENLLGFEAKPSTVLDGLCKECRKKENS